MIYLEAVVMDPEAEARRGRAGQGGQGLRLYFKIWEGLGLERRE